MSNSTKLSESKRYGGFENWLRQVDDLVGASIGLSIHDLPDQPWHTYYSVHGDSPQEAADDFISDFEEGMFDD